ncbi:IS3 family transposase, partial [Staphylococcus devriesei]
MYYEHPFETFQQPEKAIHMYINFYN